MVNEFLMDRVNVVHALLDQGDLGNALKIAKNIKLRIHDKGLLGEISDKENHIEIEYNNKFKNITGDPVAVSGKLMELDLWRIKEYITFYDTLIKTHERI